LRDADDARPFVDGNGAELFWPILGSAVKIAQSVSPHPIVLTVAESGQLGLHRDGEAFGLSTYEVQERRQVWWEVVVRFSNIVAAFL